MLEHVPDKHDKNAVEDRAIFELWRDPPENDDLVIVPEIAEIVTQQTLPTALNNILYTEMRTNDMTNLGDSLLGESQDSDSVYDPKIRRLSLAHEQLTNIPKMVCDQFGDIVTILDITDNNIGSLDFLENFTELTSLIADRNPIDSYDANMPFMPNLELLYLNYCKINDLYWVETLRYNCPKLKYLSLMGNPVVPAFMTRGNVYQYLRYRFYVISIIPTLIHLDDKKITSEERAQAKLMFPTPIFQNFLRSTRIRFPRYVRKIGGRMNDYFSVSSSPSGSTSNNIAQRNVVL